MKRARPHSPYAVGAAQLLGARIAIARRERRWTLGDLAQRVGATPPTLRKVERGDLSVGLGVAFEAAAILGVPLFHEDRARLTLDRDRAHDRLALLPDRVQAPRGDIRDDF